MSMALRMEKYQEAMRLHSESGLSSSRISKKLDVPVGTVDGWLYYGRIPSRKPEPWNRGLTQETDERVRLQAESREGQIPWNKGVPWSDLVKNKMRLAKLGKPQAEEITQKIAKANTGKKRSPEAIENLRKSHVGQVPWNKGLTGVYSKAHLKFLAEQMTGNKYSVGRVVSENTRSRISEKLSDHPVSEETRSKLREKRLLQVIPKKDTRIEVAIQEELDRRGVVYKKHVPLLGSYQVDVLIDPLTVIECNGDYWHSEEFDGGRVWELDRLKEKRLQAAGYIFHSFWGSEIRADVVGCVNQVLGVS